MLEFRDQFRIEEAGKDCDNDKIEIRDGRYGYSAVSARYCGTNFPPEVRSTNEAMWLRFISDPSIPDIGFKAVYRFEKKKGKFAGARVVCVVAAAGAASCRAYLLPTMIDNIAR